MKNRKAYTTLELLLSAGVGVLVLGGVGGVTYLSGNIGSRAITTHQAKEMLSRALYRMAPTIRQARGMDTEASDDSTLDVVLPDRDASGELVQPLQDGDDVMFYLSDKTGNPDAQGSILWRAVDGVPDAQWSMRGDEGNVDLHDVNGLQFSYLPDPDDPDTVMITLSAKTQDGRLSVTRKMSSTIAFRNHADRSDTSTDDTDDSSTY